MIGIINILNARVDNTFMSLHSEDLNF